MPFDFAVPEGRTVRGATPSLELNFADPETFIDGILNVILFLPFGYALAAWLYLVGVRQRWLALSALAAGVALSGAVEFIQGYALVRFASLADVVSNGFGAGAGAVLFVYRRERLNSASAGPMSRGKRSLTFGQAALGYAAFFTLFILLSVAFSSTTNFSGWDTSFPLLIGNETTGDRPWRGTMLSLHLLDRDVPDDELVRFASVEPSLPSSSSVVWHDFTGSAPGYPALWWNDGKILRPDSAGVHLDGDHWLRTGGSVRDVSRALDEASAFTLSTTIRTDDPGQRGPARIFSISGGLSSRNLTLGQEGTALVLRVRAELTGNDGTAPEFVVPGVFADRKFHSVVIRYGPQSLRVTVDGGTKSYRYDLGPHFAVLLGTFPARIAQLRPSTTSDWAVRIVHRVVVLLPWSIIVACQGLAAGRINRLLQVGLLIAIPAIALELALWFGVDGYNFRAGYVVLNLAITCVSWTAACWMLTDGPSGQPAGEDTVK